MQPQTFSAITKCAKIWREGVTIGPGCYVRQRGGTRTAQTPAGRLGPPHRSIGAAPPKFEGATRPSRLAWWRGRGTPPPPAPTPCRAWCAHTPGGGSPAGKWRNRLVALAMWSCWISIWALITGAKCHPTNSVFIRRSVWWLVRP